MIHARGLVQTFTTKQGKTKTEVRAVDGVDLDVAEGEVVGFLGPNGAGKTTTLLTLSGDLPPMDGNVVWEGTPTQAPLYKRARLGLSYVTEERSVLMSLTTAENLRLGGVAIDEATTLFPELEERLGVKAGLLSGGEQQMLTLARALGRHPKLLMADELSLGLAPLVVGRLYDALVGAAREGVAVVVVEQQVGRVLEIADRVYVMSRGQIEFSGTASDMRERVMEIERSYLGGGVGVESS